METLEPITTIYLVRHAETSDAERGITQSPDSRLSESGIAQARLLAKRFPVRSCDAILSSTYARSLETARILGGQVSHGEFLVLPELREYEKPPLFLGRASSDPGIKELKAQAHGAFHAGGHFEDMETDEQLGIRARGILARFEDLSAAGKQYVVVTHGTFMKMLVSLMMFGGESGYGTFHAMRMHLVFKNAAFVRCVYRHDSRLWRVYIQAI